MKFSLNKNRIYIPVYLLLSTPFLVWVSVFLIKNPDLDAYISILNTSNEFSLNIEPTIFIISSIARNLGAVLLLDPILIFYFQYIFLIQLFLLLAFYNYSGNSKLFSYTGLIFWLFIYGLIQCLIQIRFGLANAIFLYIFSLFFIAKKTFKIFLLGSLAFFTHYSSLLAVSSLFLITIRKLINNKKSYLVVHLSFFIFLFLFKLGSLLSIMPDFMLARLSGYMDNDNLDQVSVFSIYISFICYVVLIFAPKLKNEKVDALRIYGALGFLPYFIVPELEIIVRLGIPFQYLLIPYFLLTFRSNKALLYTTLPLMAFFGYKVFSSFNAFVGYMK